MVADRNVLRGTIEHPPARFSEAKTVDLAGFRT